MCLLVCVFVTCLKEKKNKTVKNMKKNKDTQDNRDNRDNHKLPHAQCTAPARVHHEPTLACAGVLVVRRRLRMCLSSQVTVRGPGAWHPLFQCWEPLTLRASCGSGWSSSSWFATRHSACTPHLLLFFAQLGKTENCFCLRQMVSRW